MAHSRVRMIKHCCLPNPGMNHPYFSRSDGVTRASRLNPFVSSNLVGWYDSTYLARRYAAPHACLYGGAKSTSCKTE